MATTNNYQKGKLHARAAAIAWQLDERPLTFSKLVDARIYFEKLGKRFGLIREFRENAII